MFLVGLLLAAGEGWCAAPAEVPEAADLKAGLFVHVGAGKGELLLKAARAGGIAHGLDADASNVEKARGAIDRAGLASHASVEMYTGGRLPYADNLVNVLVGPADQMPREEALRVLAPGGTAYLRGATGVIRVTKPRPAAMDDWTHVNHGPDGNPVSRDTLVKDPDGLRWIGSDLNGYGMFAARTAGGRIFQLFDNRVRSWGADRTSIEIEARDAFNGLLLWRVLSPFPAHTPLRPVATESRLFVLAGNDLVGLDAATGQVALTYKEAGTPYDFVLAEGVLVCRDVKTVRGLDVATGKVLWSRPSQDNPIVTDRYTREKQRVLKENFMLAWRWRLQVLIVGEGRVFLAEGQPDDKGQWIPRLVGLDLRTGRQDWTCATEDIGQLPHPCLYYQGMLLLTNERGYAAVPTTAQGQAWTKTIAGPQIAKPPLGAFGGFAGGGRDFAGFLAMDNTVWIKDTQKNTLGEAFDPASAKRKPTKAWLGLKPLTGELARQVAYPTTQPISERCYLDVGFPGTILCDNLEMVDLLHGTFTNLRAARGQCLTGFIVGNGLIYAPPNQCMGCYPMLRGAVALKEPADHGTPIDDAARLERGPAYNTAPGALEPAPADWPMYRHDAARSNRTTVALPQHLNTLWEVNLGSAITPPVIADGRLFVVALDHHRLAALDAATGRALWTRPLPARVDSPPTLAGNLVLLGCHDGFVYCLRAADGALVWRFNAAPEARRIVAFEQVESPWPVLGSVLLHRGTLYAVAGQLTRIDGGMHLWALDPATGQPFWRQHLKGRYGDQAQDAQMHWYAKEEHLLNNLLAGQGDRIRLLDPVGPWDFDAKTGRLLPPDPAGFWPWRGWDRVTAACALRGWSLEADGHATFEPRCLATDWRETDLTIQANATAMPVRIRRNPAGTLVSAARDTLKATAPVAWPEQTLPLDLPAILLIGDKLLLAGGTAARSAGIPATTPATAPGSTPAQIHALTLADGRDQLLGYLAGVPCFDGVALAQGRLYIATRDGRIVAFLGDGPAVPPAPR